MSTQTQTTCQMPQATSTTSTHQPPSRPPLPTKDRTTPDGTRHTTNKLPPLPRPHNTIRIIFQNCNGLKTTKSDLATNLSSINHLDISLIGLAETNLDWNQKSRTTEPFLKSIKSIWPHNRTTVTCSTESHNSPTGHQPGGCAQMSFGNLVPRHRSTTNDESGMGRWTSQLFQGKNNRCLRIFTAYRVSQTSSRGLGLRTAYMQQQRALNNAGLTRTSPRQRVLVDLARAIKASTDDAEDVVLLMDSNADLTETHLSNFLAQTNLHDVFHDDFFNIFLQIVSTV